MRFPLRPTVFGSDRHRPKVTAHNWVPWQRFWRVFCWRFNVDASSDVIPRSLEIRFNYPVYAKTYWDDMEAFQKPAPNYQLTVDSVSYCCDCTAQNTIYCIVSFLSRSGSGTSAILSLVCGNWDSYLFGLRSNRCGCDMLLVYWKCHLLDDMFGIEDLGFTCAQTFAFGFWKKGLKKRIILANDRDCFFLPRQGSLLKMTLIFQPVYLRELMYPSKDAMPKQQVTNTIVP